MNQDYQTQQQDQPDQQQQQNHHPSPSPSPSPAQYPHPQQAPPAQAPPQYSQPQYPQQYGQPQYPPQNNQPQYAQAPPQENTGSAGKLKTAISIVATVVAAAMIVIVIVHALGGGWGPISGTFVAYDGGFSVELTFHGREGFTVNITGEDPISGTYTMEDNVIIFEADGQTEVGLY